MSTIEVNHVTKEYRLGHLTRLKDNLTGALARMRGLKAPKRKDFKALDDIDFRVEAGEVLGIIGHNGAGKSTLLKILSNIIKPTTGTVRVQGKIAPLIETSAGLVGDLTGRENIYLNASILGISRRKISNILDEIIAFSELEEFIDTPIKRYSSGMKVKLGFSIATNIDAEILIVDEVLAVGDLAFQRKCFDRMEKMIKSEGRTVMLVSHNIRQVMRLCSRVIMLERGKILKDGDPIEVCNLFYEMSNKQIAAQHRKSIIGIAGVQGTGELELLDINILNEQGKPTTEINTRAELRVHITMKTKSPITQPEFVVGTHTTDFVYLTTNSSALLEEVQDLQPGIIEIECAIPRYPLRAGTYCIRLAVFDSYGRVVLQGESLSVFSVRASNTESKQAIVRLLEVDANWAFNSEPLGCDVGVSR